ncbi:M23 family peptidase [Methylovirgula sp. 4M-Z18]|nr:M23 family peptidase [Methylovirgula sp. 4M-Z18]
MSEHRQTRLNAAADIGFEPPIEAASRRQSAIERRKISLRWLFGTVLTGMSGAALMGAAIYSALDFDSNFADDPEFANPVHKESSATATINPKKGDRLVQSVDIVAAKQSYQAPTNVKVGGKEVVRLKTFTHLVTTLTLVDTGFADDVPPFNAQKVMADARNPIEQPPEADIAATQPPLDETEISLNITDLSGKRVVPTNGTLSQDEIHDQVNEFLGNLLAAGKKPALPIPPQLLLMHTSRAALNLPGSLAYAPLTAGTISSPLSSIEVRLVPENVTSIPKTSAPLGDSAPITTIDQRVTIVGKGDTLGSIVRANGATDDQVKSIVKAFAATPVQEGEKVKLLLADLDGSGQNKQICRVSIYRDDTLTASVAIRDTGDYVQVPAEAPAPTADAQGPIKPAAKKTVAAAKGSDDGSDDEEDQSDDSSGVRLYDSLYQTALKQDLPKSVIDDLVHIFANDVDFQRSVQPGDNFEAFYENNEDPGQEPDLLYAAITTRGETFHYYRYQTADDGLVDYYDPNGRSVRKFLIRKPVAAGELRSGFGMRYHPILHVSKMHTGVDWAAPVGTPIYAAGNGTIIKAGWDSGYGRRIEIQHANGYVTTYNHQSAFARGITEGMKVKQGQLIGYIGATGQVTGPHLHYEVLVNGSFVDPLQIRLPRTREFDGRMLAEFKRERDRIDALIAQAPNANLVAQKVAQKPPG